MSASSEPITPARFAAALPSLPLSNLHAKAAELHNSLGHLRSSNAQLAPFADPNSADYDVICEESVRENEVVMERMLERLDILKREVQDRGAIWVWDALEEKGDMSKINGHTDGDDSVEPEVEGEGHTSTSALQDSQQRRQDVGEGPRINGDRNQEQDQQQLGHRASGLPTSSGRLTDEELAKRIMERMNEDEDGDGGMHL